MCISTLSRTSQHVHRDVNPKKVQAPCHIAAVTVFSGPHHVTQRYLGAGSITPCGCFPRRSVALGRPNRPLSTCVKAGVFDGHVPGVVVCMTTPFPTCVYNGHRWSSASGFKLIRDEYYSLGCTKIMHDCSVRMYQSVHMYHRYTGVQRQS